MVEQIDMSAGSTGGGQGSSGYDADDIQVLEGLVAVRKRPGMYIGSTSTSGLHHLVWEIVDNAVDEHLAKFCSKIDITLHKDGSITVQDNGREFRQVYIKQGFLLPGRVYDFARRRKVRWIRIQKIRRFARCRCVSYKRIVRVA